MRDGFNRYVSKTKKTKSGSGASKIRQYVYFNQMSFLLPLANEKAETVNSLEDETATDDALMAEEQKFQRGRKRNRVAKEDNLIEQLAANINKKYNENTSNYEADDDKLFLLSLHGDFKKISDDYKLDAKTEMLKVVKEYKVLSSDNCVYRSQAIQSPYLHHSHQSAPYSTSAYIQRINQPGPSTSTYVQQTNQPLQISTESEAISALSPVSVDRESTQSSIHSIFNNL